MRENIRLNRPAQISDVAKLAGAWMMTGPRGLDAIARLNDRHSCRNESLRGGAVRFTLPAECAVPGERDESGLFEGGIFCPCRDVIF